MAVSLLATQVPAPQLWSTWTYLTDFNESLAAYCPNVISAKLFSTGDNITVPSRLNVNGGYLDMLSQYGGGAMGVVQGLDVAAGTGLIANVSAGGANIGGIVQLATGSTVVVAASASNFIWLKNDITLEATTATTAPATPGVFLGIAMTNGSSVTAVDTSGVCYLRGGNLWRQTADLFEPLDSPNANVRVYTKTLAGLFYWDGTVHKLIPPITQLVSAVTANKTETGTDKITIVTNEGATAKPQITLDAFPSGTRRIFVVQDSDGLRVYPSAGRTIRVNTSVSGTGTAGYIESTTVGSCIELVAVNSSQWFALNSIGTWSVV
jgi:hypothetical protein